MRPAKVTVPVGAGSDAPYGPADPWRAMATAASNGSVNSMHDSFTPLGGLAFLAGWICLAAAALR